MHTFICQRTFSLLVLLMSISLSMPSWAAAPQPTLPTPDQFFRSSLESEGAERACSPSGVRLEPANLKEINADTQQTLNWLKGWGAQHFRFKGPAGCTDWEFVLKCWQITMGLPVTGVMSAAEVKSLLAERDRTAMEFKAAYREANGGKDEPEKLSKPGTGETNDTPGVSQIADAVDSQLRRWSRSWMMDRYVSGSVMVSARRRLGDVAFAQGRFRFIRGTQAWDIPWSAQFDQKGSGWALNGLCYRDTTSQSSDCSGDDLTSDARSTQLRITEEGMEPALANSRIQKSQPQSASRSSENLSEAEWTEIRKLAENGNAEAQGSLGMALIYGRGGIKEDTNVGFKWLMLAAKNGDAKSQYNLAKILSAGDENQRHAAEGWAAACGHKPMCQRLMGVIYLRKNKPDVAMNWLKMGAEGGDAEAQMILGRFYASGKYVEKNIEKFLFWIQKAADQGLVEAQRILGQQFMNMSGNGPVQRDMGKAEHYLRLAAEQNDAESLFFLALFFNANDSDGAELMGKSAKLGYAEAQYMLGDWYRRGVGGVDQNSEKAKYWFKKAADQGHKQAKQFIK